MDNGFSAAYPIKFLSRNPIIVDQSALNAALTKRLGPMKGPADVDEKAAKSLQYFFENYPVEFKDGSIPAQLVFFHPDKEAARKERTEAIEQALQQSWAFRDAGQLYEECGYSLLQMNIMSSPLSHQLRREIIVNGVLAILEAAQVDLIYWTPTQQMLAPEEVRTRYSNPEELANPLFGFLNVRFFNISNSDGDMLMDTLGLNALGLTDFQIHFRELDPDPVAKLMYNLGAYAFEKGDVIEDGHTVGGLNDGRWKCQREMSLLPPEREVMDINPGPGFAAGNRS
jgi:Domain of unknown function (DUF4261)